MESRRRYIYRLSLAFAFVFISFQTTAGLQLTIVKSAVEDDPNFENSAFTGFIIFYAVYAISQWFVPSFIAITGPRFSMLVGAFAYFLYMVQFIYSMKIVFLSMNVILGAGAAIMWNAQGTYIARCSNMKTVTQHCGIFLTVQSLTYVLAAVIAQLVYDDIEYMDMSLRFMVLGALIITMGIGMGLLSMLPFVESNESPDLENRFSMSVFVHTLKELVKLFITKEMIMLDFLFVYTGLLYSFASHVLTPAVSHTLWIGDDPHTIARTVSTVRGVAGIVGALVFAIFGGKTTKWGRDPVVILSAGAHLIALILLYLNLPNTASSAETEDVAVFDPPQEWVVMLCGALIGCFNTAVTVQIYSMVIGTFVENGTGAFAIFKMMQSVACGVSYYYSTYISMYTQMGILIAFAIVGTAGFVLVEYMAKHGDLGPEYPSVHGFGAVRKHAPHRATE